ncbi:MAG: hypothetical protein U9Q75_09250, partial [Pseudomonadota bacterium]|nr:hypothetical protein [Pseudomonadota bacterium]
IAEDDFTSRGMLAAALKKAGHEPVETVNGLEAWEALQQPDAPCPATILNISPPMSGPTPSRPRPWTARRSRLRSRPCWLNWAESRNIPV